LELAKESCPDLIILDVMLPGIGGYDVCIQLKNDPKTSQIPVLILSCRCGDLDQQIGFNCGADDYLGKPYKSDELLGKIRKLLKINKGGVRLSEKVVVAVKDKNNFKLIKKILLKAGINDIAFMQYECDIIEAFQITKPDFIIMDLNLKDTDALNLSRKLNSIKGFSAKCIVIFDDKKEEEKFVYTEMCLLDRIIQRSKLQDKLITCLQDLS
jgi:DNA-binding response OmpR family regulator